MSYHAHQPDPTCQEVDGKDKSSEEFHPHTPPTAVMVAQPHSDCTTSDVKAVNLGRSILKKAPKQAHTIEGDIKRDLSRKASCEGEVPEDLARAKKCKTAESQAEQAAVTSQEDSLFLRENSPCHEMAPQQLQSLRKRLAHMTATTSEESSPYRSRGEAYRFPVDHPKFKLAEKGFHVLRLHCLEKTYLSVQIDKFCGGEVETFKRKVSEVVTETSTPQCKVVLIGPSGHGKSSILNNLLECISSIAVTSASGRAGTHVPHSYSRQVTDQRLPFRAQINFRSDKDIKKLVTDSFKRVYEWHHRRNEDDDDVDQLRDEAHTARDLLASLVVGVGTKLWFKSVNELERFIRDAPSATHADSLQRLTSGVLTYLRDVGSKTEGIVFESGDIDGFKEKIRTYSGPASESQAPWHMVKSIDINLQAPILEHPLTICDVPGLQDCNQTWGRSASDFLKEGDLVVAIVRIDRTVDHPVLKSLLVKCIQRRKDCVMVCTHADHFNTYDPAESTDKESKLDELHAHKAHLENHLQDLNAQRRGAQTSQEKEDLWRKCEYLEDELIRASNAFLVERHKIRNAGVKKDLQSIWQKLQRDRDGDEDGDDVQYKELVVICLSSEECKKLMLRKTSWMTEEETGFPQLKEAIREKPAKRQEEAFKNAIFRMDLALNGIILYCQRSRLERLYDVLPLVTGPGQEFARKFAIIAQRLRQNILAILENLRIKRLDAWLKSADDKAQNWAKYAWSKYLAFCRRHGEHKDNEGVRINWNLKLIKIMEKRFNRAIIAIEEAAKACQVEIAKDVSESLVGIREGLKDRPEIIGLVMKDFYEAIRLRHIAAQKSLEGLFAELKEEIATQKDYF